MQSYRSNRRRMGAAVIAAALTLTVAMQWGAGTARAEDDEEEKVPLDTKILRQFMKDLGLQREGQGAGSIQYRERAPLVVPPTRNLPPPQDASSVAANPAWPKDPDVKQRKIDAIKAKKPQLTAAEAQIADGRAIPRDELDRPGKVAAGSVGGSSTPEEGARPLKPSELGGSKSIWGSMFSSFSKEGETATFTGEPTRSSLTEPPPGYQTPSPNQPYGVGPERNKAKALTLEERTTPSNSQ